VICEKSSVQARKILNVHEAVVRRRNLNPGFRVIDRDVWCGTRLQRRDRVCDEIDAVRPRRKEWTVEAAPPSGTTENEDDHAGDQNFNRKQHGNERGARHFRFLAPSP
jgi:hypothetical protein